MFVSCRQLLKYIIYEILHRKGRKARAVESFAVFAHFAVNQIMKPSPHPLFVSPAAPSRLHSTRPCGVGACRLFRGASWMHRYPAVRGCEMDVVLVAADSS